jgi:hypothetical protein
VGDRSARLGEAVLAVPVNLAKGSDRRTVVVTLTVLPVRATRKCLFPISLLVKILVPARL